MTKTNGMGLGIALGAGAGVIFGDLLFGNVGFGISLGVCIGILLVGVLSRTSVENKEDDE